MTDTCWRRALALFLCAQPTLWAGNAAMAQTAVPQPPGEGAAVGGSAGGTAAESFAPSAGGPVSRAAPAGEGIALRAAPEAVVPLDRAVDPDTYVLGPGDYLELNFWGVQSFSLRVTVDVEGRIFVPKVGYFTVAHDTLTRARAIVAKAAARFYRLNFGMTLLRPRSFLVQVVGFVGKPGPEEARATDRVATVIGRAGGLQPNASRRRIEVKRWNGEVLHADLLLYEQTGDLKHNPYLLDGDVVRVPYEGLAAVIGGAVKRPGRFELVGTDDLPELVALAGGLAPSATDQLPITIYRRGADDHEQQLTFPFKDERVPQVPIAYNDTVTIPGVSELQRSIVVVGAVAGATVATATGAAVPDEVSATRRIPYVEGDTLTSVLDRIGGVGPLADLNASYITRQGTVIPIDLYSLIVARDRRAERQLEFGDTVVIPFKRRNILVQGAVLAPGSYPYNPSFGLEQYLALAGGRTRLALPLEEVRVITPDGKERKANEAHLQPGSSLVVPERDFSRPEIVQLILAGAGIVISGVAVVLAARK